jgi:type I restriction enzyme, S subunit
MDSTGKNGNGLPKGWVWTTLGDIQLDLSNGIVPAKEPNRQFELYSVPSFSTGKPELLTGKEIGSNKQTVNKDTVLVSKINPRINRIWRVGTHSNHTKIASTEWIPFFPINGIEPDYLLNYLTTSSFRDFLAINVSGVGGSLMRVKSSTLKDYSFPLPPLPEQKRIVTKIEELFSDLDKGVDELKAVKAQLKRYRQSVLTSAFEGKLTEKWRKANKNKLEPASVLLERIKVERKKALGKKYKELPPVDKSGLPDLPKGWEWTRVDSASERVTVGHVGSMKEEYVSNGIPFLRSQNVRPNRFDDNGLLYISSVFHGKLKKSTLFPNDVVVVRSGSVGTACVIPHSLKEANCSDLVIVKQPRGIASYFLSFYLNSVTDTRIARQRVGIALTHFNTQSVAAFPIPLPSLLEQQQIVQEVERRFSIADQVEKIVTDSLTQSKRLRQSILKRAFEGKLVPQDPKDEPAEKLLERIKEEKAKMESAKSEKSGKSSKPGNPQNSNKLKRTPKTRKPRAKSEEVDF